MQARLKIKDLFSIKVRPALLTGAPVCWPAARRLLCSGLVQAGSLQHRTDEGRAHAQLLPTPTFRLQKRVFLPGSAAAVRVNYELPLSEVFPNDRARPVPARLWLRCAARARCIACLQRRRRASTRAANCIVRQPAGSCAAGRLCQRQPRTALPAPVQASTEIGRP